MRFMKDAHAHGLEAIQTIGEQVDRCRQGLLNDGLNRLLDKRPLRQARVDWLAGFGRLYGGHDRNVVGRAVASLAALHLAAEVGVVRQIVDLDPAGELPPLLLIDHHPHDLELEQPGGGIGQCQDALEIQSRDVVLGLRH